MRKALCISAQGNKRAAQGLTKKMEQENLEENEGHLLDFRFNFGVKYSFSKSSQKLTEKVCSAGKEFADAVCQHNHTLGGFCLHFLFIPLFCDCICRGPPGSAAGAGLAKSGTECGTTEKS
jgi:hypothetical protein